jgi:hypothetical protein
VSGKVKDGQTSVGDACCGQPLTVTCVEAKEQIDRATDESALMYLHLK